MSQKKLEVEYQGVSIQDETVRIGIRLSRSGEDGRVGIGIKTADDLFCGSRAEVNMKLGDPDQMELPGTETPHIETTVDIKRYGVSPKWISASLIFATGAVDVSKLAKFAKQKGVLVIERVGDAGEGDTGDDDDEEYDEETGELLAGSAA